MPKKEAADENPSRRGSETSGGKTEKAERNPFPVVGLGASAGGLGALKAFFSRVPENSGMAFIVVIHLSPGQPSMMSELLQKISGIPVSPAADGQLIEPDHAWVIPPDKEITVRGGRIRLRALETGQKCAGFLIDALFRSLARDMGNRSVGVVLSGTGTDGTQGIQEIKAESGLVLAQSEESAEYAGMPASAIGTGRVDLVLPPGEMPEKIGSIFRDPNFGSTPDAADVPAEERAWLDKVFSMLRTHTLHDFSSYKTNTLLRRIHRRMSLQRIDGLEEYVRHLSKNPDEIQSLFQDLLIGVTHFFREPGSFEKLKDILPGRLDRMEEDGTFRAWIPGCSTGEEVYSLAILLRECIDACARRINLQLFGTDINGLAIEKARRGFFPRSIQADVDETRLKRHFIQEGDSYRIRKEIRDDIVFSVQNVLGDPPFLRLHLLCCRNLLIYLNAGAQKRILPLFHYALRPGGLLMLGSSESVGGHGKLFHCLDKKWKIFSRTEVPDALHQPIDFPWRVPPAEMDGPRLPQPSPPPAPDLSRLTRRAILDQFSPAGLLVDAQGEILHTQGRTGKYLETTSGPPTQNILVLARKGLRLELSSALRSARSSGEPVLRRKIGVQTNGDVQMINLHVRPQRTPKSLADHFLVVFEDIPGKPGVSLAEEKDPSGGDSATISELERELQIARENHQSAVEELESANEEMKSTNEEMQSSNEELQSINEELQSSKEELHSLNEELQTVNSELQSKVDELSAAQDDMRNLLNSTEIATIFVDNEIRLRRFTPPATRIVNFIESDVGRPLRDLVTNLAYEGMIADVEAVIRNLTPRNTEVATREGVWFRMRVMPYRTMDNRIAGAVITFSRIDEQKKAQEMLRETIRKTEEARELIHAIFDMNREPMAAVNDDGEIVLGNQSFFDLFGENQGNLEGIGMHSDIQTGWKNSLRGEKNSSSDPSR